jgi:hypothetical protein
MNFAKTLLNKKISGKSPLKNIATQLSNNKSLQTLANEVKIQTSDMASNKINSLASSIGTPKIDNSQEIKEPISNNETDESTNLCPPNIIEQNFKSGEELIKEVSAILLKDPNSSFLKVVSEDLNKLLMENETENHRKIHDYLVKYIINMSLNFLKKDDYISVKFIRSFLHTNRELFLPLFVIAVKENIVNGEDLTGTLIFDLFRKQLCVSKIQDKTMYGGDQNPKLTEKEINQILFLVKIYLRKQYTGYTTNKRILNEAILPAIKQSLTTKIGEDKIASILIPKIVDFTNMIFSDLSKHNNDIKKQILLMTFNSTCDFNQILKDSNNEVTPKIKNILINSIDEIIPDLKPIDPLKYSEYANKIYDHLEESFESNINENNYSKKTNSTIEGGKKSRKNIGTKRKKHRKHKKNNKTKHKKT